MLAALVQLGAVVALARHVAAPFVPFDPVREHEDYVDGTPREDGTRSFPQSRGIHLPEGHKDDPQQTMAGLSRRKDMFFQRLFCRDGVEAREGSVGVVADLVVGERTELPGSG